MPLSRQQRLEQRRFRSRQRRHENTYFKQFRKFFNDLNKRVANKIEKDKRTDRRYFLIKEKDFEGIYTKLYRNVSIKEAKKHWDKEIEDLLPGEKDMVSDAGDRTGIGVGEDRRVRIWRELIREYMETSVLSRIQETRDTTKDHISRIIEKSIDEGLGSKEIAKKIRKDTDYTRNRSIAVARTETVSAMNQGKMIASNSSGYEMEKAWISANDDRTRDTHSNMDPDNWIDINSNFNVGGSEAKQPGDPNLPASETVNCRCSVSFRIKKDSSGNAIRKEA